MIARTQNRWMAFAGLFGASLVGALAFSVAALAGSSVQPGQNATDSGQTPPPALDDHNDSPGMSPDHRGDDPTKLRIDWPLADPKVGWISTRGWYGVG